MEMDLIERCVMHSGLGLSQTGEHLQGPILDARRQSAATQDGFDIAQATMLSARILHAYMELRPGDTMLGDFFDCKLVPWNIEHCQLRTQLLKAQPGIDQGPDRHVAADP